MLDSFIYENHLGQRFVGLDNHVYLNYNDLRDYAWSYDTINNRISRFHRPITDRKLPLTVCCSSDAEAVFVKNRLMELAETDVAAKLPGKVFIGDYYTKGWITGSKKSDYLIAKKLCNIELQLTSDNPAWYMEKKYVFLPGMGESLGSGGTDYPYEYTYDYALAMQGQKIVCDSVNSNAFKLLIYGSVNDPIITINGHVYAIYGSIGSGEVLLIDSLSKTITLTTKAGNKINWFDKRGRKDYIFEPIPAGQNTVAYTGTFGFDLTIIEERSEPKWT